VTACASTGFDQRVIGSEPLRGQVIAVEVPTTVNGVLEFEGGANVAMSVSWDVWSHQRAPIEIYGTDGSLLGVNPNYFGGEPRISERGGSWGPIAIAAHPFGIDNITTRLGAPAANYRAVGVVDMAMAIRQGRPHRASGELALHVLEVLDAFERSSIEGRHVTIETSVHRPEPLPQGAGEEVFKR